MPIHTEFVKITQTDTTHTHTHTKADVWHVNIQKQIDQQTDRQTHIRTNRRYRKSHRQVDRYTRARDINTDECTYKVQRHTDNDTDVGT